MKPKERMLAALHFQEPEDRVPFWELEFQLYEELVGKSLVVGKDYAALSPAEKKKAINRNAELMIEVVEYTGQSALFGIGGYWEVGPGEPALLWLPDREAQLDLIKALKRLVGDEYMLLGRAGTVPGVPSGPNIAEYCYRLYDHRDEMIEQARTNMENSIEWGKIQCDAGADGVVMASDVAFNNGPFLPPDAIDDLITPNVYAWAQAFHDLDKVTIWHTDGNVEPIMDMVADAGVTAMQAVDPVASMDILALKERFYGRLALIGNLNCVTLQFGAPEEIDAECERIINGCKAGGGYIFGCSNAVFKGIPIESYKTALDAFAKYSAYH